MKIKPFLILLLVVNISLAKKSESSKSSESRYSSTIVKGLLSTVFSFTAAAVGEYGKNAVENLGKKVVNKVQELIE